MRWANDQHARFVLLYGPEEQSEGVVTVRDMTSGDQRRVPFADVTADLGAAVTEQA